MSDLGRVLVLAGGLTYEREVSLRSGRRVLDALRGVGVDADLSDVDAGLLSRLADVDAAFVALHGGSGEDGALRGILDLAGVPYVGTSAHASRTAFDKPTAKAIVRDAGVATPAWVALPHSTFRELGAGLVLARLVDRLGLPLMVKPAAGGSSLGASVVRDAAQLPAAMVGCFSYGDVALVERFVTGTEVAVSVLDTGTGPVALPAVEVVVPEGPYDYAARYTAGSTGFYAPARLAEEVAATVTAMAVTAHTVLGLRDLSRADAVVAPDGTVFFLEVNVSPGLTETSLLPVAAGAAGLDLGTVYRELLLRARDRGPDLVW